MNVIVSFASETELQRPTNNSELLGTLVELSALDYRDQLADRLDQDHLHW
jgi:hypothetical protein